jgi:hypothetical protein
MKILKLLTALALLAASGLEAHAYIGGPCVVKVEIIAIHYSGQEGHCPFDLGANTGAYTNSGWSVTYTNNGDLSATEIYTLNGTNAYAMASACADTNALTFWISRSDGYSCCDNGRDVTVMVTTCDGTTYPVSLRIYWGQIYGEYQLLWTPNSGYPLSLCRNYIAYDPNCGEN